LPTAETASQHALTKIPTAPITESTANGIPNLSGLESGSHETHPQTPGMHTEEPMASKAAEMPKAIAGRFMIPGSYR
jgi:hypothetical protein